MSSHFKDAHGIQLDIAPSSAETFADYRAKLSNGVSVFVKTGDQADALRELVHGIKMAEKYNGVSNV